MRAMLHAIESGEFAEATSATVRQYLEQWLEPQARGRNAGTLQTASASTLGDLRSSPIEVAMAQVEAFKVSASGQMSLPAAVRRRWKLDGGGRVDVIDLGFGVLTVPAGQAARLLDQILSAEDHYAAVAAEEDPDLIAT